MLKYGCRSNEDQARFKCPFELATFNKIHIAVNDSVQDY